MPLMHCVSVGVLSPGDVVNGERGRYRVIRLLGEGGMSRVWLAEDLSSGRYVVIKEPRIEENAGVNIRGVVREVEVLKRLMGIGGSRESEPAKHGEGH